MARRYHDIDCCRALLMLLGIPYHSALMFSYDWGPSQGVRSSFCGMLVQVLSEFRMPAFFIIAGFFAAMMLGRSSRSGWLRGRLARLGIPLVTATVVILPLQMLIFVASLGGSASAIAAAWEAMLTTPGLDWISHLWFLYNLILYSAFAAWAWPLLASITTAPLPRLVERAPFLVLVALAVAAALPLAIVAPALGATEAGGFLLKLLRDGVYFLLGIGLFLRRDIFESWLGWRADRLVAAVAMVALAAWPSLRHDHERIAMLASAGAAIGGAWIVLAAMRRWSDRPNATVSFFVDAALVIYLVHHPIIYALGLVTARTSLPPEVEFVAVMLAALALSTGAYVLIRRSPALYLLFNGRQLAAPVAALGPLPAVASRGRR